MAIDASHPTSNEVNPQVLADWSDCVDIEKKLKEEIHLKGFNASDVWRLRENLLSGYERILLNNYEFAQKVDLETRIWRNIFYRPIEGFRNLLKQSRNREQQGAEAKKRLSIEAAYLKCLDDAVTFYRKLAVKLQLVYGEIDVDMEDDIGPLDVDLQKSAVPKDVTRSCHRLLVFLGDLCRYQALMVETDMAALGRSASYYKRAARLLPGTGSPFNQLAVIALHQRRELVAVYYYFRALAVSQPFATARENLLYLFDTNRRHYASRFHQQPGDTSSSPASSYASGPFKTTVLASDVALSYVRLAGFFFDGINLEELPEVMDLASSKLQELLVDSSTGEGLQGNEISDQLLLQLVAISAFSMLRCFPENSGLDRELLPPPSSSNVCSSTIVSFFSLCSSIFSALPRFGPDDSGHLPLHIAAHVLLSVLSAHQHLLLPELASLSAREAAGVKKDKKKFEQEEEEVAARAACWKALALAIRHLGSMAGDMRLTVRTILVELNSWLPEDDDLQGFLPTATALTTLGREPALDQSRARLARMLDLIRSTSDYLESYVPPTSAAFHGCVVEHQQAILELSSAVNGTVQTLEEMTETLSPSPPPLPLTLLAPKLGRTTTLDSVGSSTSRPLESLNSSVAQLSPTLLEQPRGMVPGEVASVTAPASEPIEFGNISISQLLPTLLEQAKGTVPCDVGAVKAPASEPLEFGNSSTARPMPTLLEQSKSTVPLDAGSIRAPTSGRSDSSSRAAAGEEGPPLRRVSMPHNVPVPDVPYNMWKGARDILEEQVTSHEDAPFKAPNDIWTGMGYVEGMPEAAASKGKDSRVLTPKEGWGVRPKGVTITTHPVVATAAATASTPQAVPPRSSTEIKQAIIEAQGSTSSAQHSSVQGSRYVSCDEEDEREEVVFHAQRPIEPSTACNDQAKAFEKGKGTMHAVEGAKDRTTRDHGMQASNVSPTYVPLPKGIPNPGFGEFGGVYWAPISGGWSPSANPPASVNFPHIAGQRVQAVGSNSRRSSADMTASTLRAMPPAPSSVESLSAPQVAVVREKEEDEDEEAEIILYQPRRPSTPSYEIVLPTVPKDTALLGKSPSTPSLANLDQQVSPPGTSEGGSTVRRASGGSIAVASSAVKPSKAQPSPASLTRNPRASLPGEAAYTPLEGLQQLLPLRRTPTQDASILSQVQQVLFMPPVHETGAQSALGAPTLAPMTPEGSRGFFLLRSTSAGGAAAFPYGAGQPSSLPRLSMSTPMNVSQGFSILHIDTSGPNSLNTGASIPGEATPSSLSSPHTIGGLNSPQFPQTVLDYYKQSEANVSGPASNTNPIAPVGSHAYGGLIEAGPITRAPYGPVGSVSMPHVPLLAGYEPEIACGTDSAAVADLATTAFLAAANVLSPMTNMSPLAIRQQMELNARPSGDSPESSKDLNSLISDPAMRQIFGKLSAYAETKRSTQQASDPGNKTADPVSDVSTGVFKEIPMGNSTGLNVAPYPQGLIQPWQSATPDPQGPESTKRPQQIILQPGLDQLHQHLGSVHLFADSARKAFARHFPEVGFSVPDDVSTPQEMESVHTHTVSTAPSNAGLLLTADVSSHIPTPTLPTAPRNAELVNTADATVSSSEPGRFPEKYTTHADLSAPSPRRVGLGHTADGSKLISGPSDARDEHAIYAHPSVYETRNSEAFSTGDVSSSILPPSIFRDEHTMRVHPSVLASKHVEVLHMANETHAYAPVPVPRSAGTLHIADESAPLMGRGMFRDELVHLPAPAVRKTSVPNSEPTGFRDGTMVPPAPAPRSTGAFRIAALGEPILGPSIFRDEYAVHLHTSSPAARNAGMLHTADLTATVARPDGLRDECMAQAQPSTSALTNAAVLQTAGMSAPISRPVAFKHEQGTWTHAAQSAPGNGATLVNRTDLHAPLPGSSGPRDEPEEADIGWLAPGWEARTVPRIPPRT